MKNLINSLCSFRDNRRDSPYLAIVILTALLMIGCATTRQPATTVAPSPSPSSATTPGNFADTAQNQSMILIPAGAYVIGSTADADTQPVHSVSLKAFQIDRDEVTNTQYAEFLNALAIQPLQDAPAGQVRSNDLPQAAIALFVEGAEGSQQQPLIALDDEHSRIAIQNGRFVAQPGYEQHPVTETTWRGAKQFCQWRGARLPTEVEWEAAARSKSGRIYPWGNEQPMPDRAVYGRRSGETAPVGTHPTGATPEGLQDLAGNVAEWTSTLYRPYPYKPDDGREQSNERGERVTRGGDHVFDSAPNQLTTYYRTGFSREPDRGHRHIGFRCAQSAS